MVAVYPVSYDRDLSVVQEAELYLNDDVYSRLCTVPVSKLRNQES